MKQTYRDRDYRFGQMILTLRSAIGMTQTDLADYLGLSRFAVGEWEAGNKYPTSKHLQGFIELASQLQAFTPGREADDIRALWKAAHQKVLLDENWLSTLLDMQVVENGDHSRAAAGSPRVDWGDALAVPNFYGREWELSLLTEWVVEKRCRLVSVLGLGGIGKSALTVYLMRQVAGQFEMVIWRSLRDLPNCDALLDSLLETVAPSALDEADASLERRQSFVLDYFRSKRVLLVLDNLESVLEDGLEAGQFYSGYEGIGRFLRLCAETEHQSCVLLTSREKPSCLMPVEGSQSPVRSLRLIQLDVDSCEQLLAEKGVRGSPPERARLINAYTGNPLALKMVAQTIVDIFDGEIEPFLEHGEIIFGGVRVLLSEQFERLSDLEQTILLWLAILREPTTIAQLSLLLVNPVPGDRLMEAVQALHHRSLIERGQKPGSFTLQSLVLEYVIAQLIAHVSTEIKQGQFDYLIEHGLELAQVSDYVREAQLRLIVTPILDDLRNWCPQPARLEQKLLALMTHLSDQDTHSQGYATANLLTLLRLEHGDLHSLPLAKLKREYSSIA